MITEISRLLQNWLNTECCAVHGLKLILKVTRVDVEACLQIRFDTRKLTFIEIGHNLIHVGWTHFAPIDTTLLIWHWREDVEAFSTLRIEACVGPCRTVQVREKSSARTFLRKISWSSSL